ncbi:MAG: ABC transporter substrate-binding protein [Phycisphaerales bacterium]|nr:ABC transporter substrate-binding protein [Phycisphaerales bacterium]
MRRLRGLPRHSPDRTPAATLMTVLVTCVSIVLTSCNRAESAAKTAPAAAKTGDAVRLVSLSPAITRTLVDLGLDDDLVGRSAYCESVDATIPVVGDLYEVDFERLVRLRPTDLLIQPTGDGVPDALAVLAERHGFTIHAFQLNTVADIRTMYDRLANDFVESDDHQITARNRERVITSSLLHSIDNPPAGTVRTMLVQSLDPLLVAGTSTYLDEILRSAGGVNVVDRAGWAELSLEDATRLNPTVIIVIRSAERPAGGWRSTVLGSIDCDATREGRVVFITSPDAMLPSSAILNLIEPIELALRDLVPAP